MPDDKEFVFRLDAYSPETIPMERLAEYLAQLAKLLGEPERVHFSRLEHGSTKAICRVDREAVTKVDERLSRTRAGEGDDDARRTVRMLDDMLAKDNASGELLEEGGNVVILFPGVKRAKQEMVGPFNQPGTVDGVVSRLGGRGKNVPVHLRTRDGAEFICSATRDVARDLARHFLRQEIRCSGTGRWIRTAGGKWELKAFSITGFEVLDNRPLGEVVGELRAIPGSDWRDDPDPWRTLADIRDD